MTATVEPANIVGTTLRRVEGARKVRGSMPYAADVVLPRMLQVQLIGSQHAHAEIASIDISEAMKIDGVVAVYTGRDVHPDGPEPASRADSILARDKAIYYGQPVVAIVAMSEQA